MADAQLQDVYFAIKHLSALVSELGAAESQEADPAAAHLEAAAQALQTAAAVLATRNEPVTVPVPAPVDLGPLIGRLDAMKDVLEKVLNRPPQSMRVGLAGAGFVGQGASGTDPWKVTVANPDGLGLTDTQLRATAVPVSGMVAISNPTANPETGLAKDASLPRLVGTWSYLAGASGTFNPTGRIVGIAVHATTPGTVTIGGGASIPVPANTSIQITPNAQVTAPQVVAVGTDSVVIEMVS